MRLVRGADGCGGGWITISKDLDSGQISWKLNETAHELAHGDPPAEITAVDIPIGLPDRGPRACDLEARRLLGPGRASSVFPAPLRPVLAAASYRQACQLRYRIEQKKLSIQAWNIISKISDMDAALRRDAQLRSRIREVHPEICFFFLAGRRPLLYSKKIPQGHAQRYALLEPVFGHSLSAALADHRPLVCTKDDVLDAFAALWTAERIATGTAMTLPAEPPRDGFGLRMEIVV